MSQSSIKNAKAKLDENQNFLKKAKKRLMKAQIMVSKAEAQVNSAQQEFELQVKIQKIQETQKMMEP